jgi:hypothetical protein
MSVNQQYESSAESATSSYDDALTTAKELPALQLLKLAKAVIVEAEKKFKQDLKEATKKASQSSSKKQGSMPKGQVPPQLKKPRAWVEFTLKHAQENGWESFVIHQVHKDKITGDKIEEEIEMPESEQNEDGEFVYKDSITETNPKGKQMIHKEAMSLSKQRKETGHESYTAFEEEYVSEEESSDDSKSQTTSSTNSKTVIKKTAAEKEKEKEEKKLAKEAEKAEKKAAAEAERAAKKAEKEKEKEEKKLASEKEKAAKKAEKEKETKTIEKKETKPEPKKEVVEENTKTTAKKVATKSIKPKVSA